MAENKWNPISWVKARILSISQKTAVRAAGVSQMLISSVFIASTLFNDLSPLQLAIGSICVFSVAGVTVVSLMSVDNSEVREKELEEAVDAKLGEFVELYPELYRDTDLMQQVRTFISAGLEPSPELFRELAGRLEGIEAKGSIIVTRPDRVQTELREAVSSESPPGGGSFSEDVPTSGSSQVASPVLGEVPGPGKDGPDISGSTTPRL